MCGGVRREVCRDATLYQFAADDVLLRTVLISLHHNSRSHRLKQLFPDQRLWLCWLPKRVRVRPIAARNVFSLSRLHIVNKNDTDPVLVRHFV